MLEEKSRDLGNRKNGRLFTAKVIAINGLYVIYEIDGKQFMGDSCFSELIGMNEGDVVKIGQDRFDELWIKT